MIGGVECRMTLRIELGTYLYGSEVSSLRSGGRDLVSRVDCNFCQAFENESSGYFFAVEGSVLRFFVVEAGIWTGFIVEASTVAKLHKSSNLQRQLSQPNNLFGAEIWNFKVNRTSNSSQDSYRWTIGLSDCS